jgi:hypothetical protein
MEKMNDDKALRKVLERRSGDLPYGFDKRLMDKIMIEARKQSKRSYYLSILLVSLVSVAIFVTVFFLLNHFFGFNILEIFSKIEFGTGDKNIYSFSIYISVIILLLLGVDFKIREKIGKHN